MTQDETRIWHITVDGQLDDTIFFKRDHAEQYAEMTLRNIIAATSMGAKIEVVGGYLASDSNVRIGGEDE